VKTPTGLDARCAWDLLLQRAAATPDEVMAVEPAGRSITFGGLRDHAEELAGRLAAEGVAPGSVVSWQLPTWVEATVLSLALSRLGAVQNPLIPMLRQREVSHITSQAGSQFLVVPESWRGFDHRAMAEDIAAAMPGLRVLVVTHDGLRTSS
jgi:non-ribosomal peptide synthetase component E (peptide arylation enzyme)